MRLVSDAIPDGKTCSIFLQIVRQLKVVSVRGISHNGATYGHPVVLSRIVSDATVKLPRLNCDLAKTQFLGRFQKSLKFFLEIVTGCHNAHFSNLIGDKLSLGRIS